MNPDLERLHPYPFSRLDSLLAPLDTPPGLETVSMAIGEPRHATPEFLLDALATAACDIGRYPQSPGLPEFRHACAGWLQRRFDLSDIDPDAMVLPVSGTREGLFAFAQAIVDRHREAAVLMPNPFYQIYEGGALMAGAEPVYLKTCAQNGFLPDLDAIDATTWEHCQLIYICTPGNPTGAIADLAWLGRLVALSRRYDFVIASDECYADIYRDEDRPPPSLLQACDGDFSHCVVFHSLSKRSSAPGLRSGFVAGDPAIIDRFRLYRSYHGCAMPLHHQRASIEAWNDDQHAAENRALYRQKFDSAGIRIARAMGCPLPEAAFYLWAPTGIDDEAFAARLYSDQAVVVLPGSYLARDGNSGNPGRGHVRLSLVATPEACLEAASRIETFVSTL